ncbi:hypothetical protein TNCV_408461 [Trichonephila clavipes]|nr:hypothetical protein TNCV_408461 [Trichonephila clavipes]
MVATLPTESPKVRQLYLQDIAKYPLNCHCNNLYRRIYVQVLQQLGFKILEMKRFPSTFLKSKNEFQSTSCLSAIIRKLWEKLERSNNITIYEVSGVFEKELEAAALTINIRDVSSGDVLVI